MQCGGCDAGSCGGGGQPGVCGTSTVVDGGLVGPDGGCQPVTCAALAIDCGPAGDGCGGILECGSCDAGSCGAGGVPSVCGTPLTSCKPLTCPGLNAECGPVGDGCGNLLQCGSCDAGSCGGGGQPNVCGDIPGADAGTLSIAPASPTLAVQVGTTSTLQLQALLQTGAGSTPVAANWISSRPDLASIDQTGLVSASGPVGGTVTITAGYLDHLAQTPLTVVVTAAINAGAGPGNFTGTPASGGASSPVMLYPYDKTIIPVNLQPLDFQWEPGTGNGVFRLTLTGTLSTLIAYVSPSNPSKPSYTFDPSVWTPFAESNIGQTVTVDLAGAPSGSPATVYGAPTQSLTLASSRMAGDIYYWSVSLGEILALPAGATTPTEITVPASDVSSGGSSCIACHVISPDGSKLSAELWGGGSPGTVLNLAANGTAPPALVPGSAGIDWDFSAFAADNQSLLTTNAAGFTLRSAATGTPLAVGSGAVNGNLNAALGCGTAVPGSSDAACTHPAWSRDGDFLVYAKSNGGNDWTFSDSYLLLAQWATDGGVGTTGYFHGVRELVADNVDASDRTANVYPTISVDDSLVAFGRSSGSYCVNGSACSTDSRLDIVPIGGGAPLELVQAESLPNGGGTDTTSRFANFSPYKEGGYHWLAFFSLRPYGWQTTGTNRQIWITAVDDNGTPASDPSHPAFWLPGQSTASDNDKAQWATLPCVGEGQTCQGDIDCCGSGQDGGLLCRYADGGSTCLPAAQACSFWGSACTSDADCCTPTQCELGVCCTPMNCQQQKIDCGPTGDGCGNVIQCGACDAGSCGGGGTPGVCGSLACQPRSCQEQGLDCGPAGDGCGGSLDCGGCDAGTCGGNGVPGVCGTGVRCQPLTCAQQGLSCGPAGDGCGHEIQCGGCDAGSCGGGGTPGVCGSPSCTPQTCAKLGFTCGPTGDGCGGLLQCGSCDAGSCGGGGKPNVCGSVNFH
ncbi:MAG TPA: hypothetical protein VMB50_07200 [Myxococcales bacterium]|nr:hypothetical protein [Myxococcales bacterium]